MEGVEEIAAFKTSDGDVHESYVDACKHEAETVLERELYQIFIAQPRDDRETIVEAIMGKRTQVRSTLIKANTYHQGNTE